MKVLIVGRGGREHALCWKVRQSPLVSEVFAAPGNAGMEDCAVRVPLAESEQEKLVEFAQRAGIALTIIGPEAPLLEGLADRFREAGLKVFGPNRAAAEIEGSKAFAKELMKKYGIPTAEYAVFTDCGEALAYLQEKGAPIVVKADGLASGKGVVVAETLSEAEEAIRCMLLDHKFGEACAKIVLEESMEGEEISLMALVHGETVIPLEPAQDHKRAYDGDRGPNTGGMGAYSPVPQVKREIIEEAVETILKPCARALVQEGRPFTGVLYAGLMITEDGPKVVEFNARFGDPETQVVLPRMKSDLVEVILRLLDGETPEILWEEQGMLGVVAAAVGYPEKCETGAVLQGLTELSPDVHLFHAGTCRDEEGRFLTAGGRAFLLGAKGRTIPEARERVYRELDKVQCLGIFYRRDIGLRAYQTMQEASQGASL